MTHKKSIVSFSPIAIGPGIEVNNMKGVKKSSFFKLLIFVFITGVFLAVTSNSYAELIYPTNGMSVNGASFFFGSNCTVNDGLPSSTTYGTTRGIVTLGIDWSIIDYNTTFKVDSSFTAEIIVNVKGWNPGVSSPSGGNYTTNVTETLTVIYHPKQNVTELDKAVYTFTNVRQLQATITGIKINGISITTTTAALPQSLYLTTDLIVERYKTFNTATTPAIDTIVNLGNNQLRATWGAITGAEEYDLEWTYVDALANPQDYDFTHNSSRVTLPASSGTAYIIPNAYPSGKIIVRVRGRGRDLSLAPDFSRITYGNWSINPTGAVAWVTYATYTMGTGLEEAKNWQFITSFSEQGKRQDMIKYFDGTLRNRQSITRLNVLDSAAIIGETFYDHIGRPSIQVLPVPDVDEDTSYNHLQYRELFNRDINDDQFTYDDFDTNGVNGCDELVVNPMSITHGASFYYSANNPLQNNVPGNIYNYLPKANGFPYTQVEYMPDNTNRIRRQSGVGVTHRLTGTDINDTSYTGKETKYYYGTPFQVQLDRLFGSEVGIYKHYKKNMVIDANGQISVSYLDPYGRVVATALAGDTVTTPNLIPLESANSSVGLSCNLLDSMQVDYNNMSIVATATHLVTSPGIHSFSYTVATPSYTHCLPENWCFDCVYDLKISIKDECGLELVDDILQTQTVGNINTICDSITFTLAPNPLEIEFENPGNYVITKILTVNQEALDYYTQQFLDSSICILPLDSFIADAMNDIDTTECYGDCGDCLERLGDYSEHADSTQRYNAGYEYMTHAEYDDAVEICNAICQTPTPCSILYKQILADVSPGGQYMEYVLDSTSYIVTDTLSLLNLSYGALGDYTDITGFEEPNGSASVITIGINTFNPEHLPVNLFLQHWQNSWAQSMAPLHPEYCYYQECAAHEDSYIYDNNMLFTTTFEAARDSGFLNPIGSNPDTVPFHIGHKDPYFAPYSGTPFTTMADALDDYVGVDTTAWELIELMQNTGNSYSGDGDCWTDYDWGLFRTAYLSAKQKILQQVYEGLSSCPNWGTYLNDPFASGIKTPRFVFNAFGALGDENSMGYDLSINENSSPQEIQDEALANIEGFCDTICTSYAETWMYSLNGCGMSDADSIEIRNRLITACRGNCNGDHPLGGIEEGQVSIILEDVLGPSYITADCNPINIIQPVQNGPGAFGMLPMDSCACAKVRYAHIAFDLAASTNSLPAGMCSVQDMFVNIFGNDASMVNFDQLECFCLQKGYIEDDTIVTINPDNGLPVTTLIAPNCDMYMDFYTQADTVTANAYLDNMVEFFNQHWAKDSCIEDTFYLEDLSLPINFLNNGLPGKCFVTYSIENIPATTYTFIYVNPVSDDTIYNCSRVDSLNNYEIMDSTYYLNDSISSSVIGGQHIIFHNTCGEDCEINVSAHPCQNGVLFCNSYLICNSNIQITRLVSSFTRDSFPNICNRSLGYYSPYGPGLYSGIRMFSTSPDLLAQGRWMLWTNCFGGDSIIQANFDTTMYVPASLACEQCFTCNMLDSIQDDFITLYPFAADLFTDTTLNQFVHYLTDYLNDTYHQNFTPGQLINMSQLCNSSEERDTLQFCYEPMFTNYHDPHQECVDFLIATALSNAESKYQAYIDSVSAAFRQAYITKCLGAFETFTMEYTEREFHYTLYYYDQAGNLIKTVPPEGVAVITDTLVLDSVELHRHHPLTHPNRVIPEHELITDYRYTTLNQPARQHTPDGGITQYWYDILGRLVVSQNAKQFSGDAYSYTKYDDLGRITEVGEVEQDTAITPAHAANIVYLSNWLNAGTKTQVTSTYYDLARPGLNAPFTGSSQKNLRNRVAYTTFEETYNSSDTIYEVATHYSYDIHGNVTELVQETKALSLQQARFKLIQYEFDLISGKVLAVKYQKDKKDQFYHQYEYTHDNKLVKAKTSRDHIIWDEDATYQYYMYGAMARTELGDNNVQGVDYAYTIHGWIKGTNSNTLHALRDMGKDGYEPPSGPANAHRNFCMDVASFSLGYYRATNGSPVSDYQPISTFAVAKFFIASIDTLSNVMAINQASLFNGNISHMVTALPNCSTFAASQIFSPDPLGTVYRYDQLNRIKWMKAYSDPANLVSNNYWDTSPTNNGQTYYSNYAYDANGNLTTLNRWGNRIDSLSMDSLGYGYVTSADPYYSGQVINRLDTIAEYQASQIRYNNDIDNSSSYSYDEIGNLTEDTGEEIDNIEWTVYGKVKKVIRTTGSTKPDLEFKYNSSGQRYLKIVKPRNSSGVLNQGKWKYTYYIHDAQGNILTMYALNYEETGTLEFDENFKMLNFNLYGSSRLGIKADTVMLNKRELEIDSISVTDSSFATVSASTVTLAALDTNHVQRVTGYKNYELTNHLGNVLATVTDRKVPIPEANDTIVDYWTADINTLTDYYPFGMEMPGRNLSLGSCNTTLNTDSFVALYDDFEGAGSGEWYPIGTEISIDESNDDNVIVTGGFFGAFGVGHTFNQINGVTYTISFCLNPGNCADVMNINIKNLSGDTIYTAGPYSSLDCYTFTFTANETGTGSIEFIYASGITGIPLSGPTCGFFIDSILITYTLQHAISNCSNDTNSYMFGFNGKEKDNEVYGEGNAYTAEFWEYDPRICRRWNVDPLADKFPHQSPYAAFNDNPIYFTDPTGMAAEGNGGGDDEAKDIKDVKGTTAGSLVKQITNNQRYANMKPPTTTGVLPNKNTTQSVGNPISIGSGTTRAVEDGVETSSVSYAPLPTHTEDGTPIPDKYGGVESYRAYQDFPFEIPGETRDDRSFRHMGGIHREVMLDFGGGGYNMFGGYGRNVWVFGTFKSEAKWTNQLSQRGWTVQTVTEAVIKGESFKAVNNVNKANGATRYVHPTTGQSVVIDNVTKELLHVGGTGFKY